MATGVINGSTNSKHITAKVEWSSTPNNSTNKSSVTATLFYKKSSSSTASTYGTIKGSITINGTKTDFSKSVTLKNNDTWVQVASATIEGIAHNADGKKSITISAAGGISGTSFTSTDLSANVALDNIPRQATIKSAPNFNDEANPTITYANPAGNVVTSLQACISWTGNADIAYRDISKTGTSYTFNLTSAERTKIRNACANANSMSVTFYVKTVISGVTYYSKLAKTLSIVNATPTLNPTAVEDTDSSTDGGDAAGNIAATGSNTRWLKGISDVRYSFGAAALKGATIKSYKVECGSKKGTSASGVLFDVDSGSIKFTVTDSRGNTATQTLTRTLVNYVKLTCDLKATIALDSGETAKATLKISGNCFNGQIKSGVANSIKVWYRYKAEGGSYGGWTAVTASLSGNTYSATINVDSLDYRNNYTFEARAQDDLQLAYGKYITSGAVTVNAKPVFDWGKNDFNFNVDVSMINNKIVYGTTTDGTKINSFQPINGNNNLVLGYGGYDKQIGATHIYGDTIRLYANDDINLNNTYSLLGLAKAVRNFYTLDTTATAGTGWTVNAVNSILCGNSLRVHINATRSAASGVGNITNETVMTIKVKHDGKIREMLNVSFCSGATGGVCVFNTDNQSSDGTYLTFNVTIAATAQAITQTTSYFTIPVAIDTSYY